MSIAVGQTRAAPTTTAASAPQLEGLCRGSRGPDVKTLQESLNAKGAKLDVDGKFGPLTEAALKSFQAQQGCGGAGKVDASTVAALKAPAAAAATTPAATPTPATTAKPTAEVQTGARARCAAGDSAIRAQIGAVPTKAAAPAATTTTTPAATAAEASVALDPAQVKTALQAIDTGKKQATEEKAVLGDVKGALEREVKELETPSGQTRTVADDAVLAGRKGQLDAVSKAIEVTDLKLSGYDAAATAITDGVLTETEAKALTTVDAAVKNSEAAIVSTMGAANQLVDRGLKAGGRGSPSLGLKKPTTPAPSETPAPATTSPAGQQIAEGDVKLGQARIQTAVAGAKENLVAIANTRATIEGEIKGLKGLSNPTVADQAVLQGREAQLQVLDGAKSTVELRIAGLEAASAAIGDGVLTEAEAQGLANAETALSKSEVALASQANVAVELIRHGLAAGGRGSDVAL